MLRLASDADLHGAIVRGLRRHEAGIDLVRVQDALPEGTSDPDVLNWAAGEDRVLVTSDYKTMIGFAREHVAAGKSMPGVVAVDLRKQSIGAAIEGILLIAETITAQEMQDLMVLYLPLR